VPHAGYAFSGQVAAAGFRQLENGLYDVAVILASDHQAPLSAPISVWVEGAFETPLGVVPVDAELARALVEADPLVIDDPAAHAGEHPIEIELPFLQRVCPTCAIVPVLMGDASDETVEALAGALLDVLPGRRAVVVASSDLSHYPTYEDALTSDAAVLGAIETFDPDLVRQTIAEQMARGVPGLETCACGEGPILVTMRVARGLGANMAGILSYANSGSAEEGDREQVVGYGAVTFWRYDPPELSEEQREELLALARATLEAHLEDHPIPAYEADDPALTRLSAVFVTLKKDGELRGCIGHLRPDLPLHHAVKYSAVAAATEDPRFPPVTAEEMDAITIEVSILSPFRRLVDVARIEVGVHGLLLLKERQQGLLLPQVPVEQGWDRDEFLENLCAKAGLPGDCWQEDATIFSFTAVVFGEE
jgi:hypothetical protein